MPDKSKGIPNLYDTILSAIDTKLTFYEWIGNNDSFLKGQIVKVPAWFEKNQRWTLVDHNYDSINEKESTWKVRDFQSTIAETDQSYVKRYFRLESGEKLVTTHGKKRPAIFLNYFNSDWFNPFNKSEHIEYGLIIPLFSYKDRHNQSYILSDQKWENLSRIYIPPQYDDNLPGIESESSIQFQAIQMCNKKYIEPLKCLNNKDRMQKCFRISEMALKLIMYHFIKGINIFSSYFDGTQNPNKNDNEKDLYEVFVEILRDEISKKYGTPGPG